MEGSAPVFVRIQEYEDVLTTIESVKRKLKDAQDQLTKLKDFKAQEDKEVATWAESLEDVRSRLAAIETNLKQ